MERSTLKRIGISETIRVTLQRAAPHRASEVARSDHHLRFWALVVADKTILTEKGEPMQFITFEDETALCEAVAFPDSYKRRKRPYRVGDVVPVAGQSVRQDGLALLQVR